MAWLIVVWYILLYFHPHPPAYPIYSSKNHVNWGLWVRLMIPVRPPLVTLALPHCLIVVLSVFIGLGGVGGR